MDQKFTAFANATLLKAGDAKTPYKVGGILSTEDRDIDGEILKSCDVDYGYFTGGWGKVKYEHDEIKGPAAIIGFPTKLIKKGKNTYFEADLIPFDPNAPEDKLTPQQHLAKSTVTLLQHMDEFNKRNPNVTQQRAGWSVEGEVMSKDKKTGFVKAKISDVVFTTKPRNQNTIAYVMKSLSVGYDMSPDTQTGFGATRKESLGNNNHQSKGVSKMKTKDSVYKECLQKGMSKEEALKEANKFEKDKTDEIDESYDKAEKSLSTTKTALQKSLDSANEALGVTIDAEVDGFRGKLKKSLSTNDQGEIEDIGKFLAESNNANLKGLELFEKVAEKVDKIAKSLASRAEADLEIVNNYEFLTKSAQENLSRLASINNGLITLVKGLGGKPMAIPSETVEGKIVENDPELEKSLSKESAKKVLKGLIDEKTLDFQEMERFESGNGYMNENVAKLVKSRANDFLK